MSRITVWNPQLWAASVFALLLAGVIGCGKQEAEVARQEEAKPAESHRVEAAHANSNVLPLGAYQADVTGPMIGYDIAADGNSDVLIMGSPSPANRVRVGPTPPRAM
jgi:hypothetical protein